MAGIHYNNKKLVLNKINKYCYSSESINKNTIIITIKTFSQNSFILD